MGMRGPAIAGGSLLVAGALTVGWWSSEHQLSQVWDVPVAPLELTSDPARIEHGQHLVEHVLACGACHGDNLAGAKVIDDAWHGEVWAPNLTGDPLEVDEWVRAIRHGVGRDGQGMLFMPVSRYANLRESDLVDVLAWLTRLPKLEGVTPEVVPAPWMRMRLVADGYGASVQSAIPESMSVDVAPTAEWGAYLAQVAGCVDCHRDGNENGRSPVSVRGPVLSAASSQEWTGAQFAAAVTRGEGSAGPLKDSMPWRFYAGLTDLERDALWMWMRSDDAVAAAPEHPGVDH